MATKIEQHNLCTHYWLHSLQVHTKVPKETCNKDGEEEETPAEETMQEEMQDAGGSNKPRSTQQAKKAVQFGETRKINREDTQAYKKRKPTRYVKVAGERRRPTKTY